MHLPGALFRTDGAGLATLPSPRLGSEVERTQDWRRRLGSISHHTHVSVDPASELLEDASPFACGWKAVNPRG